MSVGVGVGFGCVGCNYGVRCRPEPFAFSILHLQFSIIWSGAMKRRQDKVQMNEAFGLQLRNVKTLKLTKKD